MQNIDYILKKQHTEPARLVRGELLESNKAEKNEVARKRKIFFKYFPKSARSTKRNVLTNLLQQLKTSLIKNSKFKMLKKLKMLDNLKIF